MTLYLQKNTNGTFCITEKNNYYDYFGVIDNLPKETNYKELTDFLKDKYNCKKLVIQF